MNLENQHDYLNEEKHPGGAPRTTAPPKEKIIELGKDLVQWATEETDDIRTSFSFWYSLKHGIIYTQWKRLKTFEEFRPYYEQARSALARKLHKQELEKGLAHRYVRMYDRELADEEDDKAKYDAELRKDTEKEKSLTVKIVSYSNDKECNSTNIPE